MYSYKEQIFQKDEEFFLGKKENDFIEDENYFNMILNLKYIRRD